MSGAGIAAAALGCAAVSWDLRTGMIPNWLAIGGIAAGLICGLWADGPGGAGMAATGAAIGFAIFVLLHWLGGMGGGDVKLMASFGALLGPSGIVLAAVLASIAGGLLAAGVLLFQPRRASIPYAPAIVLGAWLVLLGRA